MIPRYSRPEMAAIWSPETKFRIWFEIEAHAAQAMAELGVIPAEAARTIWDKGQQGRVRHCAHRRDRARGQARRHRILEPSRRDRRPRGALRAPGHDIVRRARHLPGGAAHPRRRPAARRPRRPAGGAQAPRLRAQDDGVHRPQPRRSRRADHLWPQARASLCRVRPGRATASPLPAADIATCAISGAVGTFAHVDPRVEAHVAKALGLAVEPVSSQIIPRDRHAFFFCRRWRSSQARSSAWRSRSGTCSAPRCWRPKSRSARPRRARLPCRTSATRC
jgi:adenylosuccinate lyase